MDFTPDPKVDLADAARVTLAGREFLVPVLPLRQTIKIAGIARTLQPASGELPTEDQMTEMARLVHIGLSRTYSLTLDDLLDMPVTFAELITAVPIVIEQTRAFRRAEPGEA